MTDQSLPRGMDPIDHAMLTFACRWLPFGGAPQDDVFVEFGLNTVEYTRRIITLVDRHRARIHPDTARRLLASRDTGCLLVRAPEGCAGASGA
jgi:hypothetical protein